jgi:hypothetical protein
MEIKKFLLFFMVIVCSFCVADAVFAGDTPEAAAGIEHRGSFDGVKGATLTAWEDARQDHAAARGAAPVFSGVHAAAERHYSLIDRSSEMFKVLSVVEKRVGNERLLKKIRDKLPALSDDRLKMIASLSEKIDADDHSAQTDIAFLLLTTLIIFS